MNDLPIEALKEKIEKVKEDLAQLSATGSSGRKVEVLTEYKQYLEDELEMLKREQRMAK